MSDLFVVVTIPAAKVIVHPCELSQDFHLETVCVLFSVFFILSNLLKFGCYHQIILQESLYQFTLLPSVCDYGCNNLVFA